MDNTADSTGSAETEEEFHVKNINRTDVILGRGPGGAAYSRIGNIAYRHIIWSLRTKYKNARHMGKRDVGRCVVEKIHRLGGRFLVQDPKTKKYYEVSDDQAVAKACQALREKKMEKPAGFDQKVMKIGKSKWIAQIEHAPQTPPPLCESSFRNFKISEMFSETLISALSGICGSDALRPPTPSFASDESVENQMKFGSSKERVMSIQANPSTAASLKGRATTCSIQHHASTEGTAESEVVTNHNMLRSLLPDPFTTYGEGSQEIFNSRFADSRLCLPSHIKSFFKGLLDRYIPDQDSKDEQDWINVVTQTTLDLKDTDVLGNDELSVFLDQINEATTKAAIQPSCLP